MKFLSVLSRVMSRLLLGSALLSLVILLSLRVCWTHLETITYQIEPWLKQNTPLPFEFERMNGDWNLFTPALSLHQFSVNNPNSDSPLLSVSKLDLKLDLWRSLWQNNWVFSAIDLNGLSLDLSQNTQSDPAVNRDAWRQIEQRLLTQFQQFRLQDARIQVRTPKGQMKKIQVETLAWDNRGNSHQVLGRVSIDGTAVNHLNVQGKFISNGSFDTLSGNWYLTASDLSLKDWIATWIPKSQQLSHAKLNGALWLEVQSGLPQSAVFEISKGQLVWHNQDKPNQRYQVEIPFGQIALKQTPDGEYQWMTQEFEIQSLDHPKVTLDLKAGFSSSGWRFNLRELPLAPFRPLISLLPIESDLKNAIEGINPEGRLTDLRIAKPIQGAVEFSVSGKQISTEHWQYFPGVETLDFTLSGTEDHGKLQLTSSAQQVDYGSYFQAPLEIKKTEFALHWRKVKDGLQLWSDKIAIDALDLNLLGQFSLDLPDNGSPWLSLTALADLDNLGQIWRYLPAKAFSPALTDYLSSALQGGKVKGAKLLWDGALDEFPYHDHQGIFQAWVPLKGGRFLFDHHWPAITDLNADFLFENERLSIQGRSLDLKAIQGRDLSAEIAQLSAEKPILTIKAELAGQGAAVRDYMLATPLVDSVGAALTHAQVSELIKSDIQLTIPLDGSEVEVDGRVAFNDNQVNLQTPAITLTNVQGELQFNQDEIIADNLSANLLSQPVVVNFQGENAAEFYDLQLQMSGNWQVNPLKQALGWASFTPWQGESDWAFDLDLALKDVGFDYDASLSTDLSRTRLDLPAPLDLPKGHRSNAVLKVAGNDRQFHAKFMMPNLKYQTDIQLASPLKALRSQLVFGEGRLSFNPLMKNEVTFRLPKLDLQAWQRVYADHRTLFHPPDAKPWLQIPDLSRLNLQVDQVNYQDISMNQVSLAARQKQKGLHFLISSEEVAGEAWWGDEEMLTVALDHLFVNLPQSKPSDNSFTPFSESFGEMQAKSFIDAVPAVSLSIADLWVQGYRLGRVDALLLKQKDALVLSKFEIDSGNAQVEASGRWSVMGDGQIVTAFNYGLSGNNTSDVMGRFAVTGGIQDAAFISEGRFQYQGVPWKIDLESLNGHAHFQMNKGYISGVGGAGRILGLFSFDSILRKMKLDFSGVFEDGLAFDQIEGDVLFENGIALTDNIEMNALAGDMTIKGLANLHQKNVNAQVRFVPDLTSGLPVLTAFAVNPQTALYVLAVTKVITPVVNAFTQIRYQVTGSIDAPMIKEMSRQQDEIQLSENVTERLRLQHQGLKP